MIYKFQQLLFETMWGMCNFISANRYVQLLFESPRSGRKQGKVVVAVDTRFAIFLLSFIPFFSISMSIVARNLTKAFHQQVAVNQLSFEIPIGKIVGLLGPNGSGKSTTMRMLTGYATPSSGTIHICGYDMQKAHLHAKQQIGYLPEKNPLYPYMYVREYLHLMGNMQQLSAKLCAQRIDEVIVQCEIQDMQHKKIRALSKGYQQRVGLARALLHHPKVLILDEPTTGLDPHQIHHMREVIKALSSEKAILLSTHIMQEVAAICDHVMILYHGKLRLSQSLQELGSAERLEAVFTQVTRD